MNVHAKLLKYMMSDAFINNYCQHIKDNTLSESDDFDQNRPIFPFFQINFRILAGVLTRSPHIVL